MIWLSQPTLEAAKARAAVLRARLHKKLSLKEQEEALRELQRRAGVDGEQHAAARPAAAAAAAAGGGGGGGAGG